MQGKLEIMTEKNLKNGAKRSFLEAEIAKNDQQFENYAYESTSPIGYAIKAGNSNLK